MAVHVGDELPMVRKAKRRALKQTKRKDRGISGPSEGGAVGKRFQAPPEDRIIRDGRRILQHPHSGIPAQGVWDVGIERERRRLHAGEVRPVGRLLQVRTVELGGSNRDHDALAGERRPHRGEAHHHDDRRRGRRGHFEGAEPGGVVLEQLVSVVSRADDQLRGSKDGQQIGLAERQSVDHETPALVLPRDDRGGETPYVALLELPRV